MRRPFYLVLALSLEHFEANASQHVRKDVAESTFFGYAENHNKRQMVAAEEGLGARWPLVDCWRTEWENEASLVSVSSEQTRKGPLAPC